MTEDFEKIISWYAENAGDEVDALNTGENTESELLNIEALIGEELPAAFKELYHKYNGETGDGQGPFLGHSFMDLDQITEQLEYAVAQVKPENRSIPDAAKATAILEKAAAILRTGTPKKGLFDMLSTKWTKIEAELSPNSLGGPYVYDDNDTRDILKLDSESQEAIIELAEELNTLEKETYNWDEIAVTVYANGTIDVERKDYDLDTTIVEVHPENSIKKNYFHHKWIPIFSDGGGNYMGIDLDPDTEGIKGQVIVYGRDEEFMFVLSDSLEKFFKFTYNLTQTQPELFLSEGHLHEIFREILIDNVQ